MVISWIRQHRRLVAAIGAVVVLLGIIVVGGLFLLIRYFTPPPQPLVFNHNQHIAAGATCLYCHSGATRGYVAGLPSSSKCMGCHLNVVPKNPADQKDIDQLVSYWDKKEPIQWVQVTLMADFVHFKHQPHMAAGVSCETCHGNVSQMGYATSYNLNMGFCITCHRAQQPAERAVRLTDCVTCHY
jgi:hypothetical protein